MRFSPPALSAALGAVGLAVALGLLPGTAAAAAQSCATTPAIAHRGITYVHVENTLDAVLAAIKAGAPFEIDLRSTADEQVILMHDVKIDRTTVGSGIVAEMTADEIRRHTTNDGQTIPLVEEVLGVLVAHPNAEAHLELKAVSESAMTRLTDAIVARGVTDQVLIDSFRPDQLKLFKERLPEVTAYMIHPGLPDPATLTYNASVYTTLMTQEWTDAMRSRGLVFRARHDDGPGRYRTWDLGLQHGVTSFMTDRLWDYRAYCDGKLRQPDALVSRARHTGYLGDDVYNTTAAGQTLVTSARRTSTRTFFVRLSNDGTEAATYAVRARAARSGSRVRYWYAGVDITRSLRTTRGWRPSLQPGTSRVVRVTIKVLRRAAVGSRKPAVITQSWGTTVPRHDMVRAQVNVLR